MVNYTTINDCWNALEDATSITEMYALLDGFPRWSGDWSIEIGAKDVDGITITVTNIYIDNDAPTEDQQDFYLEYCDEDEEYYESERDED